jgi:cyclin-dependent kinase regulatory subunit CKS1
MILPFVFRALGLTSDMSHQHLDDINYSDKYQDAHFEYRHVSLPKCLTKCVPRTHLMSETEWRNLGVQQSVGWVHFMLHTPEPHILMFRRPLHKEVDDDEDEEEGETHAT